MSAPALFDLRGKRVYVSGHAGMVGGIGANSAFPADFLADNLAIACNTIHAAYRCGVRKLLYLGSSCIYPRLAPQPMSPEMLLSGPLEPTNQWYAVAKIAGIKLCEAYRLQHGADFVSLMPTNLTALATITIHRTVTFPLLCCGGFTRLRLPAVQM